MSSRSIRIATLALSALPAVGMELRAPDHMVVASFYFACPEYHIPARVRTKRYSEERLKARTAPWLIGEFQKGLPPLRPYRLVGEVEVLARGNTTTLDDLHEKAREAAEKLGGDALVEVSWRDAGRTEPRIGERGHYVLTAKVARWEDERAPLVRP